MEFWKDKLWLGNWRIRVSYSDEKPEDGQSGECTPSFRYREAAIRFYPKNMEDLSDEHVSAIVCHELMHCHLDKMNDLLYRARKGSRLNKAQVVDALEETTTTLTTIVEYLALEKDEDR